MLRLDDAEIDDNDGLLQAWEIFEHVRLRDALVILSACESALGEDASGEGLLGLNRAFQFAGARGVVSSLWRVADYPTKDLMLHLHERLNAGLRIDDALREAQLELIRSGEDSWFARLMGTQNLSHPMFWAGFALSGDASPVRRHHP